MVAERQGTRVLTGRGITDARGGSIPPHSVIQVRSSAGRARECGPRGGGSSPPHLTEERIRLDEEAVPKTAGPFRSCEFESHPLRFRL